MSPRQPLSPDAKAARDRLNEHIRSFCEGMEQRKAETPIGVLALLRNELREA